MTPSLSRQAAAYMAACVLPIAAHAQSSAPTPAPVPYAAAPAIAPVLEQLEHLRPDEAHAFQVQGVRLARDAATLLLDEGHVWPLSEVNGRVIGAVWQGDGRFTFAAPDAPDRAQLKHYLDREQLDDQITSVVFLFADGTLDELARGATPTPGGAPGELSEEIVRARDYLKTYKDRTWDPSFLEPVLNGRRSGMFFALIERRHGEELVLQVDPDDPEPIRLGVRDQSPGADVDPEWVVQFARTDGPPPLRGARRRQVSVGGYKIDVDMPLASDGSVAFAAHTTARLQVPAGGAGPWVPFLLAVDLDIDSARWNGVAVPAYKNNDAYALWVRAPGPLAEGETPTLDLAYHGNLLARYGDWFVLKESTTWYPQPVDPLAPATFDVTYHTPVGYPIGSVGTLMDSTTTGRMVTSHWSHPTPMRGFSFNIGRFDVYHVEEPGSPPVTLLYSDVGHREMARELGIATLSHVKDVMTDEVSSAMKFFTSVYGPPSEGTFYATEIPLPHGEAFPGLIHLSSATFVADGDNTGFNQMFRAHEVSHQWWGIGVDFASYHDQWLSEGLADFSGLWYMQNRLGSMDKYLGMLREWRGNLLSTRDQLGATSLGYRAASGRHPQYYDYAVYQKGAWTMHMLRVLLLQLSTMNEDRFTSAMHEFYSTYRGHAATTQDLRLVMEKYAGADLGWFFDEWIDGTAIPTYTWAWRAEPGTNGGAVAHFRVRQSNVRDDFQMYVPVVVELKDGRALKTRLHVTGPVTDVALPVPGEIKGVRFNELEGVLAEVKTEGW